MYLIYSQSTVCEPQIKNNLIFYSEACYFFPTIFVELTVEFAGRERKTFSMHRCPSRTRKDGGILKMTCFLDHSGQEFMPCCTSVIKKETQKIPAHFSSLSGSTQTGETGKFSFDERPFVIDQNLMCLDSEFSKSNLASYLFLKNSSKQCILSISLSTLHSSFY